MKVLLINPPLTMHPLDASPPSKSVLLGLAYVGTAIESMGHKVNILDCFISSSNFHILPNNYRRYSMLDHEIYDYINEYSPDIIGISSMFTSYAHDTHTVARIAKEWKWEIPVIVGGSHATTFSSYILSDRNIDTIVLGEGEEIIKEIVSNKYFKANCNIVPYRPITNLDTISFPNLDLLKKDLAIINEERKSNRFLMRQPVAHLLTSRGCPNNCYFCSVKLCWSKQWRTRSAQNVVDEIELRYKQGYKEVHFIDDNSSVSKPRMKEICDGIISRHIDIRLACPTGIAITNLDYDVLLLMKQAGFYRLCFGIETGNQEHQKTIGKYINLAKAKETIAIANKLGFWTAATFIFGFPHDTPQTIGDSINFAKQSNLDHAIFYLLSPQPKTGVYEIMRQKGLLNLDPYLKYDSPEWYKIALTYHNGIATENLSVPQLHSFIALANREFLLYKLSSPQTYINLLRKIKSWEDFCYLCGLLVYPLITLRNLVFKGKQALAKANLQATPLKEVNIEKETQEN